MAQQLSPVQFRDKAIEEQLCYSGQATTAWGASPSVCCPGISRSCAAICPGSARPNGAPSLTR